MKHDPQILLRRIDQLKHARIIPSSKFQFYQGFTLTGALMVISAILFYLKNNDETMLFFSYAVLLIALLSFCIYALYAHTHDHSINTKIQKNYELLLKR